MNCLVFAYHQNHYGNDLSLVTGTLPKNPAKPFSKFWLTLRRLARMLAHAVENLFDLADVVFRHTHLHFRDLLIIALA